MEPVEITAGRLHLRSWQAGDEPVLVAACNDPETARWTSAPFPYTAQDAREYVQRIVPRGWADGTALSWAVCDSTTSEVLANLAVRKAADPDVWDVGFWCVASARGSGVVTEALGTVCRWAFAELGAVRLECRAEVGNWASRRVAEKTGFQVEGVLRSGLVHRGEHVDGWLAALLPGDEAADTAAFPPLGRPTDGVVALRRLRESDLVDVQRACDDVDAARWLPLPVPYTFEDARAWALGTVPGEWAEGKVASVAVVDARTDALLGAVALVPGRDRIGEVGYWTAPWARGRGVAGRATRLHAQWGASRLGLVRLELLTDVGNTASQRVAEKAGFVREGVARAVRAAPRSTERADMVVWSWLPDGADPR